MRLWRHCNGVWYLLHNGKQRSLKTRDEELAKAILKKLKREHHEGCLIRLYERGEKKPFRTFKEEYFQGCKHLAPATQRAYRLAIEKFEEFYGGDRPMYGITKGILRNYASHLRHLYPDKQTANDYIRALKTALYVAVEDGLLNTPIRILKQKKTDKKKYGMEKWQVKALLEAALKDEIMKVAIPLAVYCGMSRSDIIQSIIIKEHEILYKRVKTGATVVVPILDELRPYIAHLKADGIYKLVPWKDPRTYAKKFEAIVANAGLKGMGITPHKVRHTFAATMLQSGRPVNQVSQWLGHRQVSTTLDYYGHYIDKEAAYEAVRGVSFVN